MKLFKLVTYISVPEGLNTIAAGVPPVSILPISVFVWVLIMLKLPLGGSVTYAKVPEGLSATPYGLSPLIGIVFTTVLVGHYYAKRIRS